MFNHHRMFLFLTILTVLLFAASPVFSSTDTQSTSIGLYDPADGVFHPRFEEPFRFGPRNSNWSPLAWDRQGDSVFATGLYDHAGGVFHLVDGQGLRFGPRDSNWLPLSGDWNGNGRYTVALYDRADGVIHPDGEGSYRFGPRNSNWLPLAGDWNGDGRYTVALYDRSDGVIHTRGGEAFRFGPRNSNWLPLSGDWNGNGLYTVALYDQTDGVFHLQGEGSFRYGPRNSTWLSVAGITVEEIYFYDPDPDTAQIEQQVFNMINQERANEGLPALQRDSLLDEIARAHSKDMGDNNMSGEEMRTHRSSDGTTFSERLNNNDVERFVEAENLAKNSYPENDTTAVAVNGWMNSTGHMRTILDLDPRDGSIIIHPRDGVRAHYNYTGIGVYKKHGQFWFTQVFISADSSPGTAPPETDPPDAGPAFFEADVEVNFIPDGFEVTYKVTNTGGEEGEKEITRYAFAGTHIIGGIYQESIKLSPGQTWQETQEYFDADGTFDWQFYLETPDDVAKWEGRR